MSLLAALAATVIITLYFCTALGMQRLVHSMGVLLLLYALGVAMGVGWLYLESSGSFLTISAVNPEIYRAYLTISHMLGLGIVVALGLLLFPGRGKLVLLPCMGVMVVALAVSVGRGSMLFVTLVGLLLYISSNKQYKALSYAWMARFIILALLCVTMFTIAFSLETTRYKFERLFFDFGREFDEGGRGQLFANAIDRILERPVLGWGVSSSGLLTSGTPEGYPHNLYLQAWIDGGLLGLITTLMFTVIPAYLAVQALLLRPIAREYALACALYLYVWLEYMKSGNFYTGRSLVLLAVLVMVACLRGHWVPYQGARQKALS
jgi:O-antigen ligase